MPSELFEYKSSTLGNSDSINLDEAQGIVECFVAGIGNKDSVGDIVATGAFTKSLQRRKPRVVWGHSWNDPIGKVLEIYEVPNTDNRLPMKMKMAGIGGLFARVQFNLNSEKGREAFAMVAFFGEEQEWSIGYKTLRAQFDQKSQANIIYELELYEVSPVLHGANQLTGTISVKSEELSGGILMSMMNEEDPIDKAEIEKQLAAILGAKVSLMEVNDEEITFARRMDNGEVGRYKCGFSNNRGHYMFGAPRPIIVMPARKPIAPVGAMPMAMPGMPANEPQRMIRPSQMPSIPVAIKPGENGNQIVPLLPVQYENDNEGRFNPNNLDQEEEDLRDALLKIVKRHGKFNEDSEGVWAAYTPAAQNEVAGIGVKCSNCVFYQGGSACKIIDMEVEPEGKCRFAVIPKGVVKGVGSKAYELDEEFAEEDYVADLEVKYPGELAVAGLRGVVGKRRKKRRSFKFLSEFGSKSEDFEDKPYLLPVVPQFAFQVKQVLDPIFDYHGVDSYVDTSGIFMTSGVTYELIEAVDNAVANLKKKSLSENDVEWKAAGYRLGRAISGRLIDRPNIGGGRSAGRFFTSVGAEDFDPFTARDANLNGIVGEGLFLRGVPLAVTDPTPDGPGSIRNPKPSPRQVAKPNAAAISRAEIQVEKITKPKERQKLSSGSELVNLPLIDDPDVDSAEKYGAAESQRDELQGVLDGASDSDQIKKLKKAIAEIDKYMKRVEKMAEGEMADTEKPKKKPVKKQVEKTNQGLSSGYGKYLNKPEAKRTADEKSKYDGALSSGALNVGDEIPEDSPLVQEMYDEMTKQILDALLGLSLNPDSKTWQFPWRNPEAYARNPTSGRIYQGTNQMLLQLTASARGYQTSRWAGAGQWKKRGGKISAKDLSTKGVKVLVPQRGRESVDLNGNIVSGPKTYKVMEVFNVAEVKGLPEKFYALEDVEINKEQRLQDLETVIQEIGPAFVESKGSQAFYRPGTDKIHMPAFEQFKDALAFYGTAMHETVHWTSHPSRLDRKLGKTFGDEGYAFEELIAEIGSAFAMGSMGLEPVIREDHILYLNAWMKKLQSDPTAVHRAILQAQQANDYLLNRSATMRRLAGIPDDERKGKIDTWLEVPSIAGYEDSPLVPPSGSISGFIEDMLDLDQFDESPSAQMARMMIPNPDGELSRDEKIIRASEFVGDIGKKGRDGSVIGADGLSSGKVKGPIKGAKDGVPEIKRSDRSISYRRVFKLKVEPTAEQRDILDLVIHLVRNKDPKVLSVLAGAGTGKTTSLKNVAWVLEREFDVPSKGEGRIEHLKYLTDRYGISFDGMNDAAIDKAVKELAEKNKIGDMYYAVFGVKNQLDAELQFPGNTGIATTSKIWYYSLALGQGDEKFGKNLKRKIQAGLLTRDGEKRFGKKRNPKFVSEEKTPDEPPMIPYDFSGVTFDGDTVTVSGKRPGFIELGWQRLDDGANWVDFLKLKERSDKITFTRGDAELEGFKLPNGAEVTVEEFGDLFNKAMRRWTLSVDEKASKKMFLMSELEREGLESAKGQKKIARGEISPVDATFTEQEIPDEWVGLLQGAVDQMLDGDSNVLLHRDAGPKVWMLTNPDLRTDPGLVGHAGTSSIKNKTIPKSYEVGGTYEIDGEEWVVTSVKPNKGGTQMAKLSKRFATKEKPLAAFFVDEAQDSNPIIEKVLLDNRENLPIIAVGDDRQGVFAFNDAKNILSSIDPDYELEITQSFRYGDNVAHLGNLVLALQNLYLEKQGVKQPPWKHVKGEAQGVVYRNFDDLLPEKDRVLKDLPELSDAERREKILHIEETYSTLDRKIDISDLPRKEQDKVLLALRNEVVTPKAGIIVDAAEEIKKGNLPTMILTRSNRQIINEAQGFLMQFLLSPRGKDKNGNSIMPEIVIPAKKHAEMSAFAEHLLYIMLPEASKKEYEKKRNGRPPESSIIGPVWNIGQLKRKVNQSQYSQLTTLFRLTQQPDPNDPSGLPLGARGLLRLLNGSTKREKDAKGKETLRVIPPVMIAERDTLELPAFAVSPEQIKKIASHKTVKTNVRKGDSGQDNQLEKVEIIPPLNSKMVHAVYGQLEIEGGGPTKPGKATGRIFITGDGVDTGRPTILPGGVEKPVEGRTGNGRYRRDMEKIIERLGLGEKVKLGNELAKQREGASRRSHDGFIIDAGSLDENAKILTQIAFELRESAREVGGDVEITTAQLAKGRESRFVVLAEDFMNPSEVMVDKPKGESAVSWMEETNLVYVALTRAQEMIDPGSSIFESYLADGVTADQRRGIEEAAKRGDIPEVINKGAFADGKIALPDKYDKLNRGITPSKDQDNEPVGEIEVVEDTEGLDEDEVDVPELPDIEGEEDDEDNLDNETDSILDKQDEERILDIGGEGDPEDIDPPSMGLSSGASSSPRNTPARDGGRLNRRGASGGSRIYDGSRSAQEIAGIRFRGDLKSPKEQAKLNFSMNVWKRFRDVGIAIDVDDDASETEARKSKNAATIKSVGAEMKKRQNLVRVGRVGDNNVNDAPSALTWMLSVDKLAETLRVPTEFVSANRDGKSSLQWTQTRPVTRKELATLLGLNGPNAAMLEAPDAGINHDAVRLLIAELGKQPELSAWRYFSPVSAEEVAKVIPPSPSGAVEEFSKIDLALENVGRANMRDRFIIETFGKDAFPHWFDPEEGESITPDEYSKLGEISAVSKFRSTGRFDPEDPTKGDSEAEYDLYGELIDGVLPSAEPDGELISGDKTSREDFELEKLLEYLGIDRKEWKTTLKERMSAAFGMDAVGAWDEWKKDGIPTATVAHMIRTGLIPNAASVWKDASTGERFDNELKKSKYAVYEALNEFIDKSFPNSKLNSQASRNTITGKTDMGVALRDAAAAKGSAWSPKKGNEARFSDSELQSIVDRFNEVFGTNHTIDDIFSAEQLRTAAERIESGETLSGKKRTVS